ncbi:MAG: hypothetical protein KDC88_06120 [Ignavibacteriae bacterium]|nr:hypothetical protein [Ignavibacteriota bacterium]MCB9209492.1 hypothetical protein [Ignavibacteriales bacterium]MCB9258135.1 hypothetical protein [Ignavibacteriales bacterium]
MATLPPSPVKEFPADSLEKQVYSMVNSLEDKIPLMNDRNRLAFALLNFLRGQGDPPLVTVRNNKLTLANITKEELAELLEKKLEEIKK